MQDVVHDSQDLLEVLVPRLGALELVEVDHLVEDDDQPGVPCKPNEGREQLETVIDVAVVDDISDAQGLPGLRLGRVFPAQPTQRRPLTGGVAVLAGAPIGFEHRREIVATIMVLQRS
ncbi:hypothetical protein D3C77_485970 [compost metagenome]